MTLSLAQLAAREGRLTASRVACLMSGDERAILGLWREMVGDPAYEPEDLSGNWAVQLGSVTEGLNLDFYERRTGRTLTRRGEVVCKPGFGWAAATLDGWDADHPSGPAVIEAKHVGGFEPIGTVIQRYAPQCAWQRIVTGAPVLLSIIEGAREPVIEPAAWDEEYAAELWRRAEAFMACVWDLVPPVVLAPVQAPVPPERYRSLDLVEMEEAGEPLPNWAYELMSCAASWAETIDAAKGNAAAAKAIKDLLPGDVGLCITAAAKISRAKNGAVTVRSA